MAGNLVYGDASAAPLNVISERIFDNIPPQIKIFEYGYPKSNVLASFLIKKDSENVSYFRNFQQLPAA